MSKIVLSVGYGVPGNLAEYISLESKRSLLDGDVIIFRPSLDQFGIDGSTYQGKPSLSETNSFNLKDCASHWRSQLQLIVQSGKNVFVILKKKDQVWIDSGRRQYSGTGRNQKTTRMVDEYDTYQMLPPLLIDVVASEGREMKLAEKADLLSPYWKDFGALSAYEVYVECDNCKPLIRTKSGDKIVGALLAFGDGKGHLVLLPPIPDFDNGPDDYHWEDEIEWTEEEDKFGHRFLAAILAIDDALRRSSFVSPPPSWINQNKFHTPKESELQKRILKLDSDVEQLLADKLVLTSEISEEQSLKRLLYEKGTPLEDAINEALNILGFSSEPFKDAESEFDAVFDSLEGRFLGEVEGKDNKQVNVDKLRQLEMNIQEDFEKDGVTVFAKGVLFGNAYRLEDPDARPKEFFTKKCITAAQRSGTALVRTPDLYRAAIHLKYCPNDDFARACREAIFSANGTIVAFPEAAGEDGRDTIQHSAADAPE